MYVKKLILFVAILCLFGCAKQMFENESPLSYHGNDKFLQQISQQALELDKKLNFSAKLMSEGDVNWDSVSYQASIVSPETRILLLPFTKTQNGIKKFIKFKVENTRLLEAPVLTNETRTVPKLITTLEKKNLTKKSNSKSDGSRMTMSSLCRVDLYPIIQYNLFNSGSLFDPEYWTYMSNEIRNVLTNNGCEVGQITVTLGQSISVMTDAVGVGILQNQSFFEMYRVGYNYPWMHVYSVEHQHSPQVSCGDDGGGGGGVGTGPGIPPVDPEEDEEKKCDENFLSNSSINNQSIWISSEEIQNNGISRIIRHKYQLWSMSSIIGSQKFQVTFEEYHVKDGNDGTWTMQGIDTDSIIITETSTIPGIEFILQQSATPKVELERRSASLTIYFTVKMKIVCSNGLINTVIEPNGIFGKHFQIRD